MGKIDLFVGYAEHKDEYKLHGHIGNDSDMFSVYLYANWQHFALYNGGRKNNLNHESMTRQWKQGDVIGIEIDFDANESVAYFNGNRVGVMFTKLPKVIVPAVSMFYEGM